jgi:predicted AlkP superfamily phosphohydrolase/phosphomutase
MTDSKCKSKLMIIGLDGATFNVLMPWIKQNKLPTIAKIMQEGTISDLESTIPPITPVAWKSFMTGKNPGSHGTYDFYSIKPGTYERGLAMKFKRRSRTLWNVLSNNGKKCCIFNVPHTYPPEKVNGCLVSGFLSPGLESEFTYPREFKNKLLKEIPEYRMHERVPYSETDIGRERFLKEVFDITDVHARAAKFIMNEFNWDFFMMYFKQTDSIAHFFWKYMDKTHPLYDESAHGKYGTKILELYQKIDEIILSILKNLDDNTNIILMSDHGFGPHYGNFYINNWLLKNGYLRIKSSINSYLKSMMASIGFTPESLVKTLSNIGINVSKYKFDRKISFEKKSKLLKKLFLSLNDIDWNNSTAFSMGYYGPIYINLKNKFPKGNVSKGAEYDKIRKEIKNKLLNVKQSRESKNIVDNVWFKEELYDGEYLDEAPDIVLSINNFSYASSALFEFGSNRMFSRPITPKSGDHSLYGILMMRGPNIKENHRLRNAKIIDLFPTILHLLDCKLPNDVDGRVLFDSINK